MTPQYSKPSCHNVIIDKTTSGDVNSRAVGFGLTTNIINGGLECGKGKDYREEDRIGFYKRYLKVIGISDKREKSCRAMYSF